LVLRTVHIGERADREKEKKGAVGGEFLPVPTVDRRRRVNDDGGRGDLGVFRTEGKKPRSLPGER